MGVQAGLRDGDSVVLQNLYRCESKNTQLCSFLDGVLEVVVSLLSDGREHGLVDIAIILDGLSMRQITSNIELSWSSPLRRTLSNE